MTEEPREYCELREVRLSPSGAVTPKIADRFKVELETLQSLGWHGLESTDDHHGLVLWRPVSGGTPTDA